MIAQSGDLGVAGYVSQGFAEGAIGYVNYSYALGVAVPGRQGAQRGRLLHRADAAERGRLAAAGADQHRRERPGRLPHPAARRRLHRHRPAQLPAVVVLVPHPADEGRRPVQRGQGQDAGRVRLLRDVPGPAAVGVARLLADADQPGQASFDQIRKIPGVVVQDIDIATCKNPTFSADGSNLLADNAPQPQECDQQGLPASARTAPAACPTLPTASQALRSVVAPVVTTPGGAVVRRWYDGRAAVRRRWDHAGRCGRPGCRRAWRPSARRRL